MKIRMLKTTQGSPDGIHVATYREGEVYETTPALTSVLLRGELAVTVEDQVEVEPEVEEEEDAFDVGDYSIQQVLSAVREGEITAEEALHQETEGLGRTTLIGDLQARIRRNEG